MNAVAMEPQDRQTAEAAEALDGLARLRLSGLLTAATAPQLREPRRMLEARTGGTLVLRANRIVCRALRTTRTIAAFALSTGTGM